MIHRPQGFVLTALFFFLVLQGFQASPAQTGSSARGPAAGPDQRAGTLDMILLLDKSLSMAPYFDKAKNYAAGNLIGPILVSGDRLIVEVVYGKTVRLISTTIATEADKAKVIRTIRAVKADGHFTDLGAALDAAKRDLDELGQPERPKYVVLITDERQEAPPGSPYQATDYKLVHPALEYVKKVDLGQFRAITVGLQVGKKVNQAAPAVMQLLMDPPVRNEAGEMAGGAAGAGGTKGVPAGAEGGPTKSERALPSWLLYGAAGILAVAIIGVVVALLVAGRRKEPGAEGAKKTAGNQ